MDKSIFAEPPPTQINTLVVQVRGMPGMPFIMELSLAGSVFRRPAPAAQWILQSFPAGKAELDATGGSKLLG